MTTQSSRVLKAIHSEPWLITDEWLDRIVEIANRENIGSFDATPKSPAVSMAGTTAILDVRGPVFRYANLFTEISGASSTEVLSSELAKLDKDKKVSHIILRYDTPGGMASGASEMSDQIRNLSTPHTAYVTGLCCSLGYFWASQSPQIVIAEDAIVGNIGTRTTAPQQRSDDDMVSKNAPNKILSKDAAQNIIDALEDVFVSHVARGRDVTPDHVYKHYGKGAVFVGQQAIDAGIADRIMTIDSLINQQANSMSEVKKDADQTKDEAYTAGFEAGKAEAKVAFESGLQAHAEKSAEAENARCVAIFEASAGKPLASILPLVKQRALSAEQAIEVIESFPSSNSLDSMMEGTNPSISNDDDTQQVQSVWAAIASK